MRLHACACQQLVWLGPCCTTGTWHQGQSTPNVQVNAAGSSYFDSSHNCLACNLLDDSQGRPACTMSSNCSLSRWSGMNRWPTIGTTPVHDSCGQTTAQFSNTYQGCTLLDRMAWCAWIMHNLAEVQPLSMCQNISRLQVAPGGCALRGSN